MLRATLGMLAFGIGLLVAPPSWAADAAPDGPKPPVISVKSGIFTNSFTVTVKGQGGVIRFTTTGNEPTAASMVYSNPIPVRDSMVLKTKVFDGDKKSETAVEVYTFLDGDLVDFSSNIPLVIVQSYGRQITKDRKIGASVFFFQTNAPGHRAMLAGPVDFGGRAQLNRRGYTSLRYPKPSYHVKLKDPTGDNLKAPLLGMPKGSDWILYGPYPDKTFMRDVLAYEISNEMGRYAPRTKFVEVFANEAGGSISRRDYLGVYVLIEKIKQDKNRVAIEKVKEKDLAEPEISGGYIFKKDHTIPVDVHGGGGGGNFGGFPMGGGFSSGGVMSGPGGFPGDPAGFMDADGGGHDRIGRGRAVNVDRVYVYDTGFRSAEGVQFEIVDPDPSKLSRPQKAWLAKYVNQLEASIYGPKFRDAKEGYAAFLDPGSFIDHHLLVEVTKNIDGFRFSTFFHKDRNGKVAMGPIWDWNLSMGNANGKQGWMPEHWYWPQLDDRQYSWFRRLFEDPDFAQRYVDRWGEVKNNQMSSVRFMARVDGYAALLQEAQERNYKKWRVLGRQVWPETYVGRTFDDEIKYLKQWMQKRFDWIGRQFVSAPIVSAKGGAVTLRSAAQRVLYTLDGSDPRQSGGSPSPKAKVYSEPVSVPAGGSLSARALEGGRWSPPSIWKPAVAPAQ